MNKVKKQLVMLIFLVGALLLAIKSTDYLLDFPRRGGATTTLWNERGGAAPYHRAQYVTEYTEGDKYWLKHADTKINYSYSDIAKPYARYICQAGSASPPHLFGPIEPICLSSNNAKMVLSSNGYTYVFRLPAGTGLVEQKHMTENTTPHQYYEAGNASTIYFVVPFDGYEVPTYTPDGAAMYLPRWRTAFQQKHTVTADQFSEHIHVVGARLVQSNLLVDYVYTIDWIQLPMTDSFAVDKNVIEGVDHFTFPQTVMTLEQVVQTAKNHEPVLYFDINTDIDFAADGALTLTMNNGQRQGNCFNGNELNLETGKLSAAQSIGCIIQ